jgi:hypothetical protein
LAQLPEGQAEGLRQRYEKARVLLLEPGDA